jgi:hypothetical protein
LNKGKLFVYYHPALWEALTLILCAQYCLLE